MDENSSTISGATTTTVRDEESGTSNKELTDDKWDDDLRVIAKWARQHLFKTCKFVDGKGIGAGSLESAHSRTYKLYERDCVSQLRGMKSTNTKEQNRQYAHTLWGVAKSKNTIPNALSVKRSCVYTVMLNRFNGKRWME
jgi:hypothetical protein